MKLTGTQETVDVLLVEAESEYASRIRNDISEAGRFLFESDYRLTHVETVPEAQRLVDDSFDVVLLDTETEDDGSFGTLEYIVDETDGAVPVVVLTDLTNRENAVEAIERGAHTGGQK
ncbi:MAG: hypothetical protein SV253_08415 [Halobacteria archaeon]|nr:hypothetical protein [Halobacteria archaeon]